MNNIELTELESETFDTLQINSAQQEWLQHAVADYIEVFDQRQDNALSLVQDPSQSDLNEWLKEPPTDSQCSTSADLEHLFSTLRAATETGLETTAGTQLSYIPGNGLRSAALGRYIAAVQNRWTGAAFGCPGAVALEQSVINWITSLFGFGAAAGGIFLSGGSMANFTATVAARCRIGEDFRNSTIYVSGNAHHSIMKACRLAGLPLANVRRIKLDSEFKLDVQDLEATLTEDVAAGFQPMMIVATAGTTDAGVIDPLDDCARLARQFNGWLHVDAAYGGFFMLTDRGRKQLTGIEKADSITVDAHKSLFMPFGIGALIVADRKYLQDANCGRGAYMRDADSLDHLPDFCALGPELTRPFRGLELWLPLHLHGVNAFKNELNRMLDLAINASTQLRNIDGIELVSSPSLSIVCFRSRNSDETTQTMLDTINRTGEVHVSSTTLNGKLAIRLAFLNCRTTVTMVNRVIHLVRESIERYE